MAKSKPGYQQSLAVKIMEENKEYQNHYCNHMPTEGIAVIYFDPYDVGDKKRWWLSICEEATEEDVEEFEAEEVGEILSNYEIPIIFCPFCGTDLRNIIITCIK